jgi:hypothetical protein
LGSGRGALALAASLLWCGCSGSTLGGLNADGGAAPADGGIDAPPLHPVGEACPAPTIVPTCGEDTLQCWKTCGPARSGFRNCTCDDATWGMACDSVCRYEPGADLSCFALPAAVAACPPTDELGLPMATRPCQLDPCRPCGSRTDPGYLDSSGAPKAGFCVCVPNPATGESVYSCAGVTDWPPQRPPTLE